MDSLAGKLAGRIAKGVKRWMRSIFRRIDNIKLGDKLLLTSVFCVLVPLVITDTALLASIAGAEQQRRLVEIDNDITAARNCLDNMTTYMNTAMVSLYTSSELYSFLDTEYSDPVQYYSSYLKNKSMIRNVMYGANTYIRNLTVYADNDTLYGGGGVYKLEPVKEEGWYRFFDGSGLEMAMYSNAESTYYSYSKMRVISLISYLKFNKYSNRHVKIARFDLNYSYFMDILRQQNFTDDVYICNDEYILFSTTDSSTGTGDFIPVSQIEPGKALKESDYIINGQKWHIYVFRKADSQPEMLMILKKDAGLFIMLFVLNILLPLTVIYFINRSIVLRIVDVSSHISMVQEQKYEKISSDEAQDEIGMLIRNYNLMVGRIQDLIRNEIESKVRQRDYEIGRQRAELLALRSQINPHFLFNALESIRMRSLIKKENETSEAIELLARLMRRSTDWSSDLVTLSEEAGFAETYLKLQQYRFGERLNYSINISEQCRELRVPKLTLSTFVENACVHGVEKLSRSCDVLLSADIEDGCLVMYIEDTGAGIDEEKCAEILRQMREGNIEQLMEAHSVGILNACLRLRRCFDDKVGFEIESEKNVGTCVEIRIPLEQMKKVKEFGSDA